MEVWVWEYPAFFTFLFKTECCVEGLFAHGENYRCWGEIQSSTNQCTQQATAQLILYI